jgi:hypothetical protein
MTVTLVAVRRGGAARPHCDHPKRVRVQGECQRPRPTARKRKPLKTRRMYMCFAHGKNTKAVISEGREEGDWRATLFGLHFYPHAAKFTAPGRRKTEVEFVRETLHRRLASHNQRHDQDPHGDQPQRLIIQPELTSYSYWERLKTMAVKDFSPTTGTAIQKYL